VTVLNPRARVPVGLIIDDSTCLVNLNRFSVPQFAQARGPDSSYHRIPWRDWPVEIPDSFVRKFGEWCAAHGVKGKYSIVPYPALVGRLDRTLPGWTQPELERSIELVRTLMMPSWDIHPEMVTHTRVIDTKTGHPYPEFSPRFIENWDWTTGRSPESRLPCSSLPVVARARGCRCPRRAALAAADSATPNIVVKLADDYSWASMSCQGAKGIEPPCLDRLDRPMDN